MVITRLPSRTSHAHVLRFAHFAIKNQPRRWQWRGYPLEKTGHALQDEAQLQVLTTRVTRAQRGAIVLMLDDGLSCEDILTQIAALSRGRVSASFTLISTGLKEESATRVPNRRNRFETSELIPSLASPRSNTRPHRAMQFLGVEDRNTESRDRDKEQTLISGSRRSRHHREINSREIRTPSANDRPSRIDPATRTARDRARITTAASDSVRRGSATIPALTNDVDRLARR